jgi:ABC-2 type transport system permease protein
MRVPLSAELLKQRGQRGTLAWGFAAAPAFATFLAFTLELAVPVAAGAPLSVSVHPIRSAMRSLSIAGDPVAQLFYAIGAAAFFAVEYRCATWRHVVPRNSRAALLVSKMLGFGLCAGASLVLLVAGDLAASLIPALTRGFALSDAPPATLANLALAFGTSFLELLALGGTVALLAVVTRSATGAFMAAFLLSATLATCESLLRISGDQLAMLPLPPLDADAIRSWISADAANPGASGASAGLAAASLAGWFALTFGTAIFLFNRQDLTAE